MAEGCSGIRFPRLPEYKGMTFWGLVFFGVHGGNSSSAYHVENEQIDG